jgi:hypothetical protein
VRALPGNRERVTGVEPATLCLASTRSSQLSYTRKSEEVLVAARLSGVNLSRPEIEPATVSGTFAAARFVTVLRLASWNTSRLPLASSVQRESGRLAGTRPLHP